MNKGRSEPSSVQDFPSLFCLPRGFSLVEMTIGIFVLSILLGLTSLSFTRLSPRYRLKKAVWELNSRLNYARYKAVFESRKVKVSFTPTHYSIEKYDDEQDLWEMDFKQELEGILLDANNSPIFYPAGTVSNLATIIVSNSWGKYRITIAITGRIKILLL